MRNLYTVRKTRDAERSALRKVFCTIGGTIVVSVLILLCDICKDCGVPLNDLIVAILVTTLGVAFMVAWAFLTISSIFEEGEKDRK